MADWRWPSRSEGASCSRRRRMSRSSSCAPPRPARSCPACSRRPSVSQSSKYTPEIDIWSIGYIFTELLTGRPLIPEKNVVHQLDLITDLGSPSSETLSWIQNEKSRRYLSCMWKNNLSPLLRSFQMLILKIDIEPKRLWLIRTLQVLPMRNVSPQDIQFQNSSLNWTNESGQKMILENCFIERKQMQTWMRWFTWQRNSRAATSPEVRVYDYAAAQMNKALKISYPGQHLIHSSPERPTIPSTAPPQNIQSKRPVSPPHHPALDPPAKKTKPATLSKD